MTLPQQLRAIADGLDALTAARNALIDELAGIAADKIALLDSWDEPDSAAVSVAAEERESGEALGTVTSPAAPIDAQVESGRGVSAAGVSMPPSSAPPAATCPECGKQTPTAAGLVTHRSRMHHVKPAKKGAKPALIVDGDPTEPNGHDFKKGPGTHWFTCPDCPVKYSTKLRLDEHRARAHRESSGEAKRPTIAERVAARDAGRAADAARRGHRAPRAGGGFRD